MQCSDNALEMHWQYSDSIADTVANVSTSFIILRSSFWRWDGDEDGKEEGEGEKDVGGI